MANQFAEDIELLKKYNEKFSVHLQKIDSLIKEGNYPKAYTESYSMEALAEKLVSLARLTPIASGSKDAYRRVSENIEAVHKIKIEYTDKGWFSMQIPALLPRKEKGSASYIRATVLSAMNSYFLTNSHPKFSVPSVLIFEHIYSKERPERACRDHDNIEINVIVDLIALYCLVDDSPMLLRHYYTSRAGEEDGTNIYIIPASDFQTWLSRKEGDPDD